MGPFAVDPEARRGEAADPAAPGARGPGGRNEVRGERPARRPGARLGARVGGAGGGRAPSASCSCGSAASRSAAASSLSAPWWSGSPRSFAALEKVREDSPLRAIDAGAREANGRRGGRGEGEGRDARRLDPRRGARSAGRPRSPSPPGTASSTAASGQALLSVPAVKAVEFGGAIEASRGPGLGARTTRSRQGRRRQAPAPNQPRRRARGGRHQRRGPGRRRVHEAHLDARPGPGLGGPGDRRARSRRLRAQRRHRGRRPAASSPRPCWRSCWPTLSWS